MNQEAKEPNEGKQDWCRAFCHTLTHEPVRVLQPRKVESIVAPGDTMDRAIALMQEHHVGYALVLEDGRLVGIVTERDVLRKVAGQGVPADEIPVAEVMTPDPEILYLDDPIVLALNKMSAGGFRHLPIVDHDHVPFSVVSVVNVVNFLVDFFPHKVLTLPPTRENIATTREGA